MKAFGSGDLDTLDTISGFSGKSYEKSVQEKDPGNRENGVHRARYPGARGIKREHLIDIVQKIN